jgi:ABC-type multidrug transport system fused ATPase/permease subunit
LFQPYQNQISKNSSESISSITTHVNTVVSYVLQPLALLMISIIVIVGIITTLILVNPGVAFFAALIFGFSYALIMLLTKGILRRNSIIVSSNQARVVKALQEGLGAVRDVLINNLQNVYSDMYQKADQPMRKAQSVNLFIAGSPRFIMETVGLIVLALIAFFSLSSKGGAGSLVLLGTIAFGAQRLLPVLQQAYAAWAGMRSSIGSLENVIETMKLPIGEHHKVNSEDIQVLPLNNAITFNNVRYKYSEQLPEVLKGLSFVINRGERIGIVGDTGSGKSTALDILMGLLKPVSGEILIDDVILSDSNVKSWQKNISQVPQSIFLTDATIAENIGFGFSLNELDLGRVKTAAQKAHVAEFIESKANGYFELVGERGVALSGGQRQRIAIARALYKNASVLIFDEATSALDNLTEKAVIDSIKELGRDITIIMIAHRLSTIETCDKIIELRQGKMEAVGTYPELLLKSDSFRKLVNSNNHESNGG